MIEIVVPLVALVALLVVWAKLCPPIKDPYVPNPFISWHATGLAIDISIDPEQMERITKEIRAMSTTFWKIAQANETAAQHMQHLHIELKPLEDLR